MLIGRAEWSDEQKDIAEIPYLITPWAHQKEAIDIAAQRMNYALFFEMGTGKTMTAINIYRKWCVMEGRVLSSVIFCPPIVVRQWAEEIEKNSKVGHLVQPLDGPGKKRKATLENSLGENSPRLYITNYETLLMKDCYQLLLEAGLDTAIFDESHKLKNHKAKRTKLATQLAETIPRKLILTGSPVLNSPADLFSQFQVLDNGRTFGTNFFVFQAKYFFDKNAGFRGTKQYFPLWLPRPGSADELNKVIKDKSMVVKKADCLDLPPLVRERLDVPMGKEQQKAYNEIKEDLVAYLGSGVASADMALTKVLRLQQIVSGFVKVVEISKDNVEKIKIHRFKDVPRLKVQKELIQELAPEHKIIVWCSFIENYKDIAAICEELKLEYVEIHGQKSAKQKQQAVDRFRGEREVRICIANPKAGGVGLNLTEASYSSYYSRGYSYEDDIQSEARNYRGGSECHRKVTRIDLVSPGTIDEGILRALRNKESIANKILDMKDEL